LAVIEDGLLVAMLVLLIVMAGGQIILRNVFGTGLMDMDSLSRLLVLWLGMIGAVVASRKNKQINVDVLSPLLTERARTVVAITINLFTTFISMVVAYYLFVFLQIEFESGSTVFASVPAWVAIIVLPLSFALIAFHYLLHAVSGCYQYSRIDKQS
jgi:TRAP-type C4-dicarboxylate transport system permease small subunit